MGTRITSLASLIVFLCVVCINLAGAKECNAALILQFGQGSSIGNSNFSLAPGSTISVNVYLTQIGETRLDDESTSVNAYEFNLALVDLPGAAPSSDVSFVNSIMYGPSFGTSGTTSFGSNVGTVAGESTKPLLASLEVAGVTTSDDGVADMSVLLATIEIQATGAARGSFMLTATGASDGLGSKFTSPDTVILGGLSVNSGSVNLDASAVPEPSSMGVAILVLAAGGCRFRRARPVSSSQRNS